MHKDIGTENTRVRVGASLMGRARRQIGSNLRISERVFVDKQEK